jgi:acyl-CoA synthetase (AMP-forming)/AMP-acid ligase II
VEHAVAIGWPAVGTTADGIVAFVSGNFGSVDELLERAKAALPPYIVPRRIFTVAEMPLNPNGKVDRRALKERLPSLMGETSDAAKGSS